METQKNLRVVDRTKIGVRAVTVLILAAAACFPLIVSSPYLVHVGILVLIYASLASTLCLIIGYAGLMSFAHGAFVGVGAYTTALLCLRAGMTPWLAPFIGGIVCSLLSVVISLSSVRIKGSYLAIVTIGFQQILVVVLLNWVALTNGPGGLTGIPRMWAGADWLTAYFYIIFIVTLAIIIGLTRLVNSPLGLVLSAMREDDIGVRALGANVNLLRVYVFGLSHFLVGFTGGLYALYIGSICPYSFTIDLSTMILAMVLIGGSTSIWGSVIGAFILGVVPEFVRGYLGAGMRMVVFGLILILCLRYMPNGLAGVISKALKRKPVLGHQERGGLGLNGAADSPMQGNN